ncbi:MAG: hypothetical protein JST66_01660 [Bacteroidetes bacterium]|nr:hypothetical protein [Bacteroidota bacterium]
MRWTLDDNERSAFHYLIGGVVAVLVLKGLALGFDAFGTSALPKDEAVVLAPFRQGYLLGQDITVVGTATGRTERIALAVVLSIGLSLLLGGVAALVARAFRGRPGRAAVRMARIALVALLGWSLYAALFMPVRQATVTDRGLLLAHRRAVIGDLPLPFTLQVDTVPRTGIQRLEAVRTPCRNGCDGRLRLELTRTDGRQDVLAEENGICPPRELERLRTASEAAALLERELHGGLH